MRAQGVFTCAVVALHLFFFTSSVENVVVVKEKWSNADKKQITPWINLSTVKSKGYDACVRLRLYIKPLSANKTLRIEFYELGVRNFRNLLIQRGRHDNNTISWKLMFDDQSTRVKIRKRSSINKHLDIRRERVVYYPGVDTSRPTVCPLNDKILPGGGEVLSSSSLKLFGSSVLKWEHKCPLIQFKPDVSLCWQHIRNHSQCVSVQNSSLLMSNLKYNVSDVDKHPHMCLKFFLNGSHHVFCPFSSGDLSEWDVTVVPGFQRLSVRLSSSIPATFAAQLCVEEGETCVLKENVHTVQMEGLRDVEMTVPLPFFTLGMCVQVWRTEPALRGRRIICPDYTHRRWGLIVAASLGLLVAITTVGIVTYNLIKQQTSAWCSAERKPVLLVCSSDETSHISAVCALAYGLQEELHMDVRLAQWAQCSTQTSLAQLGPAPWLYGQCQQVHSVGGMVLIAWSPKAQQTFLQWRERASGGKADKAGQMDKVLLEEQSDKQGQKCTESQSSITAPVFNASLISMWAGLQSERHGQGFGLVCFRGLSNTRCIPKELRGIQRYCLPRDLSNLIHQMDVNVHGPRHRVQNRSKWCCWSRLLSKGLSFWLSQRLAQRLDAWLPQTPAKPDSKHLPKRSHKNASEKVLRKKFKKKRKEKKNIKGNLDTQKVLLG